MQNLQNAEKKWATGITRLCLLSYDLWHFGYADQAWQQIQEAHQLAQTLAQPSSLVESATFMAINRILCREFQSVQAYAETAIGLATEHGLPHYLSHATIYRGVALAMQGHAADGIEQSLQGLALQRSIGGALGKATFPAMLAEA